MDRSGNSGYGIGTVNYMVDGNLFATLRITQIPSLLVVVEGRVVHYRGAMNTLSAKAIRLFARDSIPGTFLNRINSYSLLRRFLDQWQTTNKVKLQLRPSVSSISRHFLCNFFVFFSHQSSSSVARRSRVCDTCFPR